MNVPSSQFECHASFVGRIGVWREDITPPLGIYLRNWGAARHETAESVHRPLTLTALTLSRREGEEPLVLVDADLGWWRDLDVFRSFQKRVLAELSLAPSRFIFALTHTHSAVPLMAPDRSLPGAELLGHYLDRLGQATVAAVREADRRATAATLQWHTGRCRLAANRDFPDPAGSGRLLCGYNPASEADDALLVGRVTDGSGTVRAILVNYACHPTTLGWENRAISPDYVGAMRQTVEAATGAPALFLQGASGDLAPRYQYLADPAVADRHGRQLGHAALAALDDMAPPGMCLRFSGAVESGAPLAVWEYEPTVGSSTLRALQTAVELPLKDWPAAEQLERQRRSCTDRVLRERLRRQRDIQRVLGNRRSFPLPLWAWRLGDALLVGSMAEAYSLLQQQLRRQVPGRTVVCLNLINGSIGYLPPQSLYDRDLYQVWQTPFDRGSLEATINAMTDALRRIGAD